MTGPGIEPVTPAPLVKGITNELSRPISIVFLAITITLLPYKDFCLLRNTQQSSPCQDLLIKQLPDQRLSQHQI